MNNLLKIILSLSLSGTLLILVFLLCKPLVKDKLSKRWQYYIWLIVVARLLFPFAPETNLIGTIFQHLDNVAIQMDGKPQTEQAPSSLSETDFSAQYNIPNQVVTDDGKKLKSGKMTAPSMFEMVKQNFNVICLLVWVIVAVGLFIRKITIYQSFVKYIKAGRIEISDMAHWEHVGKLVDQLHLKGTVGLYTNSLISSPLLVGFFHPCIMLPTIELSESDFENTILHELTHYKRWDMFYKWLVQVAICLHWFNPFVYLMGREVNRTCELSCDEAVIKLLDEEGRRAYGDTLLNAMDLGGSYKNSLASVTLNEGKELLKERLSAIMKFTNPSKFKKFITAFLTFAICIGAAFSGVYADTPKKVSEQNREKMNEIDRITPEQADEMALELTNRIWVWEWVEFFIPYMSEDGVKQIIPASASSEWVGMLNYSTMSPMEPFTQAQLDNARNRKSEKAYLTKTDINNHALMIMESNGRWDCVDFMLPYMTENGINQVLNLYAGKHGVQMPIAENPSNNANNVTNADAEALEIMQNTGNWSYIEPYLPQMTNTGIDAVVNCYNSKHFNPNEFKKASDYYN